MKLKDVQFRNVVREPGSNSNRSHFTEKVGGWRVLLDEHRDVWIIAPGNRDWRWVPLHNVQDGRPEFLPPDILAQLKVLDEAAAKPANTNAAKAKGAA